MVACTLPGALLFTRVNGAAASSPTAEAHSVRRSRRRRLLGVYVAPFGRYVAQIFKKSFYLLNYISKYLNLTFPCQQYGSPPVATDPIENKYKAPVV